MLLKASRATRLERLAEALKSAEVVRKLMLYYLSQYLLELVGGHAVGGHISALRLFRYITSRSAGAAVTALLLSRWLGPKVIGWLKELSFGQNYRDRAEVAGNWPRA